MLVERVFEIGGVLLAATGGVLIAASVWGGFDPYAIGYLETGVLLLGFGLFFVYVGREARRDRRKLLELGELGGVGRPPAPPTR